MIRNAHFVKRILRIAPKTIIHVGADMAQDRSAYKIIGADQIYWCEANPESARALGLRYPNDNVINGLFWNVSDSEIKFYRTNNPAQNSAIQPLSNSEMDLKDSIVLRTKTLDQEFSKLEINRPLMLVIDVQGAEENVLNGGLELLQKCDFVIIEIALKSQGYSYAPTEFGLDKFLRSHNFRKSIYREGKAGTYRITI